MYDAKQLLFLVFQREKTFFVSCQVRLCIYNKEGKNGEKQIFLPSHFPF